jgi:hypothetical protein
MAISKDIPEEDVDTPLVPESPEMTDIIPPFDPPEVEPIISLNALTGFSAPQTLNLIGYIKHRKVIILDDSGKHPQFYSLPHCPRNPLLHPCCQQFPNHDCQWWFYEMWWATVKMCISKSVTTTSNPICLLLTWAVATLCWVQTS